MLGVFLSTLFLLKARRYYAEVGSSIRAAVEELKHYREAIRRAHPGQVFEDSVELLRQAREERTRELEQR